MAFLGVPWALRVADRAVEDRRTEMADEMRRTAGELSEMLLALALRADDAGAAVEHFEILTGSDPDHVLSLGEVVAENLLKLQLDFLQRSLRRNGTG